MNGSANGYPHIQLQSGHFPRPLTASLSYSFFNQGLPISETAPSRFPTRRGHHTTPSVFRTASGSIPKHGQQRRKHTVQRATLQLPSSAITGVPCSTTCPPPLPSLTHAISPPNQSPWTAKFPPERLYSVYRSTTSSFHSLRANRSSRALPASPTPTRQRAHRALTTTLAPGHRPVGTSASSIWQRLDRANGGTITPRPSLRSTADSTRRNPPPQAGPRWWIYRASTRELDTHSITIPSSILNPHHIPCTNQIAAPTEAASPHRSRLTPGGSYIVDLHFSDNFSHVRKSAPFQRGPSTARRYE